MQSDNSILRSHITFYSIPNFGPFPEVGTGGKILLSVTDGSYIQVKGLLLPPTLSMLGISEGVLIST